MLKRILITIIILTLLAACAPGGPQPNQPVTGMPSGTDGMPWWNDAVFYEILVRSFYDSDGDGIGDFNGIIEKLDYLNDGNPETDTDLGITDLWLMPIHPSPSYHGYDVTDYYAVNPDYGTLEDFKRLLSEAHKRGIRVTIDLVINHSSAQHPWFIEASLDPQSEFRDWYIWSDTDPGYPGPWGQKVWIETANGYYYALFWDQMPDLNYTHPAVRAEMTKVANFWLSDVGVDGFRLDAARHIIEDGKIQENTKATHDWWKEFRLAYKAANPEAITLGEIWSPNISVVKYVQGDELDLAFNFDLASAIVDNVNNRIASILASSLRSSYNQYPEGQYATFLTNHDQNRVMIQFMKDEDKARLAASVLLTTPGVPFIYYGEEIGTIGAKPDEDIRTPMQWSGEKQAGFTSGIAWRAPQMDFAKKNVALQAADPNSLLSHYRTLIHLRMDHSALRVGDLQIVEAGKTKLLAFLRSSDQETVLVLINLGKEDLQDYALNLKTGNLPDKITPYLLLGNGEPAKPEINSAGGFNDYKPLEVIPANATVVIQLVNQK